MKTPSSSDKQFIALWNELKSATLVAKRMGVGVRTAMRRRADIEARYNIKLVASPDAKPVEASEVRPEELDELRELLVACDATSM